MTKTNSLFHQKTQNQSIVAKILGHFPHEETEKICSSDKSLKLLLLSITVMNPKVVSHVPSWSSQYEQYEPDDCICWIRKDLQRGHRAALFILEAKCVRQQHMRGLICGWVSGEVLPSGTTWHHEAPSPWSDSSQSSFRRGAFCVYSRNSSVSRRNEWMNGCGALCPPQLQRSQAKLTWKYRLRGKGKH